MREFLERQSTLLGFHFGIASVPEVAARYDEEGDRYVASLLTGEEQEQFRRFRVRKRKVEWLAGRAAAKSAFARYARSVRTGDPSEPVSVLNDRDRAPFIQDHAEVQLSITHSHGYAVAVVAPFEIGVDLERIERRPLSLTHYFFSDEEQELASEGEGDSQARDELITRIWSRKEAVSKFLKRGGSLDFKELNVVDDEVECSRGRIRVLSAEKDGYCISLAMSLSGLAA
jgi:phosphopantetheinyl transferase